MPALQHLLRIVLYYVYKWTHAKAGEARARERAEKGATMEPGGGSHLETAAQVVVDLLVACGSLALVGGVVACTLALPTVLGDLSALRLDRAVNELWPGLTLCASGALSFAGVLLAGGWRSERRVSSMPIGRRIGPWWQAPVVRWQPSQGPLGWPLMASLISSLAPAEENGVWGVRVGSPEHTNGGRAAPQGARTRAWSNGSTWGAQSGDGIGHRTEGAGSARHDAAHEDGTEPLPHGSVAGWLIGEPEALKTWALKTWEGLADRASEHAAARAKRLPRSHGTSLYTVRADGRRSVRGPAARRRRATRR